MIWEHTSWLSKSHKLNDYHDKPWLQEERQRLKQTPKQMKTTVEAVIHKSFTSLTGTSIQEVKEKKLAWSRGGPTPILSGQLWCWISTRWLCGKHWLFSFNAQHQHQFLMYTDILWGGKDTTRRNQGEQCQFHFHSTSTWWTWWWGCPLRYTTKEQVARDDPPNVLAIGILPEVHVQSITD